MHFLVEYCNRCNCRFVYCPKCGHSTHFGGTGRVEIEGSEYYDDINEEWRLETEHCDVCPLAQEHQRFMVPDFYQNIGDLSVNGQVVGTTNRNHVDYIFDNEGMIPTDIEIRPKAEVKMVLKDFNLENLKLLLYGK
jgi:hypothetical protein